MFGDTVKRKTAPDQKRAAQRAALNALRRAKRAAEMSGVVLSDWEGEFLGSVQARVEAYGRAFRDPEKGPGNAALSTRQTLKMKEIGAKAQGKAKRFGRFGSGGSSRP